MGAYHFLRILIKSTIMILFSFAYMFYYLGYNAIPAFVLFCLGFFVNYKMAKIVAVN